MAVSVRCEIITEFNVFFWWLFLSAVKLSQIISFYLLAFSIRGFVSLELPGQCVFVLFFSPASIQMFLSVGICHLSCLECVYTCVFLVFCLFACLFLCFTVFVDLFAYSFLCFPALI